MIEAHHHKAKLTPELVAAMRREAHADPSISLYTFAARHNVSRTAVSNALYGLSYKTLDVPPLDKFKRPKSRQQHPSYKPKGDTRILERRFCPSCRECANFIKGPQPSCKVSKARAHILSFPYEHTRCRGFKKESSNGV